MGGQAVNISALRRSRPRRARPSTRRKAIIAAVAALAAGGVGYGGWSLAQYLSAAAATCANDGITVVLHKGPAGECVGITDGTFPYQFDIQGQSPAADKTLAHVESLIAMEDRKIRDSGQSYVSVVYLLPAPGGVLPVTTFADQLAGAYAAQHADNAATPLDFNDKLKVQLLIASSGVGADQYQAVDAIIRGEMASQHVVAVAGIGISVANTIAQVRDLTAGGGPDGLPVFGSTITSDEFDNIPFLVRASPSNKQEIDALLSFIKPPRGRAFLIEDTNPADSYSLTISREFKSDLPVGSFVADEPFNSASAADRLSLLGSDICSQEPNMVLFGGRGRDLGTLIADLAHRDCLTTPVTILTGDDIINMPMTAGVAAGLASGVTVDYAGTMNPAEWTAAPQPVLIRGTDSYPQARQGFEQFSEEFTGLFGVNADSGGNAAVAYDATRMAIRAIGLAGGVPSPAEVAGEFSAIQISKTLYGASGPVQLSAVYTGKHPQGSNPVGKVIPILALTRDGQTRFRHLGQAAVIPPGS
jgi:ABC-type branched-subunit amino acid transport system substrate-binding protein